MSTIDNHTITLENYREQSAFSTVTYLRAHYEQIPEKDRGFFNSVNSQYQTKGNISTKQLYWMHRYVKDILSISNNTKKLTSEAISKITSFKYKRIYTMMERAYDRGLKKPIIKLKLSKCEAVIKWDRYHYANPCIHFCGDRELMILLEKDGKVSDKVNKNLLLDNDKVAVLLDMMKELQTFDDDPAQTAKIQGRLTGNCCFCNHPLSTTESISVGYGPICADTYGLPWGEISDGAMVDILSCDLLE